MEPKSFFGVDTMNAPWGLDSRLKLVALACEFFDARKLASNHKAIGKDVPSGTNSEPLTGHDFLEYLQMARSYRRKPNGLRVAQMVEQMVSSGVLVRAGYGNRSFAGLGDHYLYLATEWDAVRGGFRFAHVLGPDFLYFLCAPALVHITGTNKDGDEVAGTGVVVHRSHVLTCRHVVCDMKVHTRQTIQRKTYAISEESIHTHSEVDVAVIQVDGAPLTGFPGAIFQRPVVAQTVYTLGYPKLPGLREASVTMQQGAVTNESVTSLSGESLFLYSAISRPGNSGGPVVSEDGYIVGLSIVDARAEYCSDEAFSPHYAGIPSQVVVEAVASLGLGMELPYEDYE